MNTFDTLCLWTGRLFVLLVLTGFASGVLIGVKGWLTARREGYRPRTPEPDDTQELPACVVRPQELAWWNDEAAINDALTGIAAATEHTPDIDSADYWPGAA